MTARGLLAASLAIGLAGAAIVIQGIAVPVQAQLAQATLKAAFEQRLVAAKGDNGDPLAAAELPPLTRKSRNIPILPLEGPIARISVERLDVEDIVLAGNGSHEQLARGPTMLRRGDAASPVTVLAAHRDTHFAFIRDLREGDELIMEYVTGDVERYRVTAFETVRWNAFSFPLAPARPLLALTTCYPFGGSEYGGPWRRVAWAERLE